MIEGDFEEAYKKWSDGVSNMMINFCYDFINLATVLKTE